MSEEKNPALLAVETQKKFRKLLVTADPQFGGNLFDRNALDIKINDKLFSKIVPNCRKLGLLDAGEGWLREKFTEIGVIEFEHMPDTGDEFLEYDLQEENFEEKAQSMHEAAAATAMGNAEA